MHPAWRRCSSLEYDRVFAVVAPGQPGASPPSVPRPIYEMGSSTRRSPAADRLDPAAIIPPSVIAVGDVLGAARILVIDDEPANVRMLDRLLTTSGYADEALTSEGLRGERVHFLPKPYTGTTLLRKVREVLDARPAT